MLSGIFFQLLISQKHSWLQINPSQHTTSRGRPLIVLFCGDVPDHNRTKIGRIKFLIYYGSVMSDKHLVSGNTENISLKTYFMDND